MDFTLDVFKSLLTTLLDSGYMIMPVSDWSSNDVSASKSQLLLRHDVDRKPERSVTTAGIEHSLGVRGTYYFRISKGSYDVNIIREIASLGHEIGYHYEDLDLTSRKSKVESPKSKAERLKAKDKSQESSGKVEQEFVKVAFESFKEHLARLREVVPVNTICMHGSPMSRFDNRLLWKYFDYGELGIETEPYFDISMEDMLYLTDTGRRWDGAGVSIRDRVYAHDEAYYREWLRKPVVGSSMYMTETGLHLFRAHRFRNTKDIMAAAQDGLLPERILLTLHPQRWSDSFPAWVSELVAQNFKNLGKYIIKRQSFGSGN